MKMSVFHQFENNYRNILCDALEYTYECIVLTDADGYILYMNRPYQEFLNVSDVIGRHVTEVIENTRMHLVAQTARAEIADIQRIQGHDMIANRIPIVRDGRVVAVIGTVMFQDVRQLYALAATVDHLRKEVDYYKGKLTRKSRPASVVSTRFEDIVGTNHQMVALKQLAARIGKSDTTILITGESGTGKELFARAIHTASQRGLGPFVTVNCAAIPDTLLESELFGYEGGAFTGASPTGKKGKFELADRGTLLLDEIGDMPLHLQAKLLRVLQEREIERVGGTQPIPVDVRIISSTHQNIAERIHQRQFREDLFYRLNVINLHIPPLRERREDIQTLSVQMIDQLQKTTGLQVGCIEEAVWGKLFNHRWPGNVRELRNVIERAMHMMDGDELRAEHIFFPFDEFDPDAADSAEVASMPRLPNGTLKERVARAEKSVIEEALIATGGNRLEAAKRLGISKSALYQKLTDYRI